MTKISLVTQKETENPNNRGSNISAASEELPGRVQAVSGMKSGAHAPTMENLIEAFAAKERLFREVRNIVNGLDKKHKL